MPLKSMSPSDKNKSSGNSTSGEGQSQLCSESSIMDFSSESSSPSTSNVTLPGHGTIVNIPWVTATQSTVKCSVNYHMKTFDPGEDSGIERLTSCNSGNSVFSGKSSSNLIRNSNKSYKAGSKINRLADMLAKRSQNVVEVKQNSTSDIILDKNCAPKVEEQSVISHNFSTMKNVNGSLFENPKNNEFKLFRKSRRKSVPNQSCSFHQWQLQSTSKSCSDISKLFSVEENEKNEMNALRGLMSKLQTDESTKKKVIRKNLRNVKLPLILPERKRRSSLKIDSVITSKFLDRVVENPSATTTEIINESRESLNEVMTPLQSSKPNIRCTKLKKEKVKQRKSKRLVENSTQTADIEFISMIRPNANVTNEKPLTDVIDKPIVTYECLYCTQTFAVGSLCKAHEKTHSFRNNKQFKCQYCSKKLTSLEELKSHCVHKHPNKYAYCMKCNERFPTKEELYFHNKEIHINKIGESQNIGVEENPKSPLQENKPDEIEEKLDKKISKNIPKPDLKIDVSFDSSKKSCISPRNIQKCSPKEIKTEEQLLEMEMLFYSHLSGNIKENLTNHLDGKIDKSGNPVRTDQMVESAETDKISSLLSVVAPSSGISDVQVSRAPSPYQTRSKTPNPLPPTAKKFKKLPNWQQKFWEKYNFPTNYRYEHRFWDKNYLNSEKSAFHLKDLSCLDIKTQLTMRENIKKLDEIKKIEENSKSPDKFKFPDYLSLVPRVNKINSQENKTDLQKSGSDCSKGKKPSGKEEIKKSFKSPVFELPIVKNRSKINSDNFSTSKKQTTEGVKMVTRRQSSMESVKDEKEENSKKRKGSLDLSGNQRMALRRQTSLDNLGSIAFKVEKNDEALECNVNYIDLDTTPLSPTDSAEISGEWVRPRSYLCGTCCTKFTNLWELEDHKWISHPNVWCTHYEFEDEKIDKLFQKNEIETLEEDPEESSEVSKCKLTDLYKRYLLPHGSLKTAKLVPKTNFPEQCTKCKKNCLNSSDMHKHMLDCGGDTTWFLTMYSSPMTIKRKWRPFGSRRKKQIGRRDVKRNIPSTPTLRPYHYQHRIKTKPGDVESIQKMLANLPEKRARRAINFDEIKTRSQATIHSNRLLRKRFKSSFSSNLIKLKSIKQKRHLKQRKKEGNSKSTTDSSSENTPIGSPKRKNKLKENLHLLKEENSRDGSSETSEDTNIKITKNKVSSKKKESADWMQQKNELGKDDKPKIKKEISEKMKEKPVTRRKNFVLTVEGKPKRKLSAVKEQVSDSVGNNSSLTENKEGKNLIKSQKITKKNINKLAVKKEITASEELYLNSDINASKAREIPVRVGKRKKLSAEDTLKIKKFKKNISHWDSFLRLKQSNKAKTELLKSIQKKVKNSKKILEKKKVERTEGGSRRSLRIKSLQQLGINSEFFSGQPAENSKKNETDTSEKDLKIKNVVVSLENAAFRKANKPVCEKSPKINDQKIEREISEAPIIRRSLRNSISFEEKPEMLKNDDNSVVLINPRSLLRRNFKNEKNSPILNTFKDIRIKTPKLNSDEKSSAVTSQVSLLKKSRYQNTRALRRAIKSGEFARAKNCNSKKNSDLEEMPILAKVEPIRGKISNKNEKEIPILMPFEKDQKKSSGEKDQIIENSVSFQVIKKRRKNSKEITPLKIVKKIENSLSESGDDMNNFFPININDIINLENTSDDVKNKKKKLSDVPVTNTIGKKAKTDVKKYFLGVDPTEIDKGRKEGQDESGSDNEPLICLVSNLAQSDSDDIILKEEIMKIEAERPDMTFEIEPPVKKFKNKSNDIPMELPILFCPSEEKDDNITENIEREKKVLEETKKLKKKMKSKKKKRALSKTAKELPITVTLEEPALKLIDDIVEFPGESNSKHVEEKEMDTPVVEPDTESVLPQRRSRRVSKEIKLSNEFIIDDPLILVDELWSDLDSDSDSAKRKSKKGKKKSPKKKICEEKKISNVNLEELLRNFGENKEIKKSERPPKINSSSIKIIKIRKRASRNLGEVRKAIENRKLGKSYKRLSLKLFLFNKTYKNFGNRGVKLSDAKEALQQKLDEMQAKSGALPDLPFLAAEIKENPVQVIQCRAQKLKPMRKGLKKIEPKNQNSDIHLKISLPLEIVNNMTVFNNNHLTELIVEEAKQNIRAVEEIAPSENSKSQQELSNFLETPSEKDIQMIEEDLTVPPEIHDESYLKSKAKRSEVIDKIFYCEICKTYYYSSSQLKMHKLSNRHKLKESELLQAQKSTAELEINEIADPEDSKSQPSNESAPVVGNALREYFGEGNTEMERLNDDTLEMPILEGPFIENPLTRLATESIQTPPPPPPPPPPPASSFGFSQESLKDIQKAIGCTDEEMLILTLLGENTIEIENDILDLDSCKSTQSKPSNVQKEKIESSLKEKEKVNANGAFTVDLKQRMTSALACLVNKAVFNLLQKYETAAKSAVNPEAMSLLGKLSNLSRRKNILQLNELLKRRGDGEPSVSLITKDIEKKEPAISYKYQCTICGSRFEKASTRECHISRSHRGKAKKLAEDMQALQTVHEDEWNDSWSYGAGDDHLGISNASQFWCSDCGINFLSPQEVLEHQKVEHQAILKEPEEIKGSGPLQSSTIGSSDEILEGKKTRRRPKLFSSEELDQQRIIANNELRKLDRKFSNRNKSSKIKWGMDALKFTVEKENKMVIEEEKEIAHEEHLKPSVEVKNIDLVPKLNLSRISNIPEFKVIQKNSFENRFQKIIDNKLKRKCVCPSQEENAGDEVEEEVMLVPVVVKKKNKKHKVNKCLTKKEESGKPLDVYDFNESESEGEPAVYSHIKKPTTSLTKLKLVKVKEGPSKNKADSTTKDLAPDDYDSEDSLPLSVVKKSKPGDEEDEKDEKISGDTLEKSDGILEQVEYLIEQLENETGPSEKENHSKSIELEQDSDSEKHKTSEHLKKDSINSVFTTTSLRVSVANEFLEIDELQLKNHKIDDCDDKKAELPLEEERALSPEPEGDSVLAEPESSQSTFDEEDSIPLVMISKKSDQSKFHQEEKKSDENITDVSTTASEDVSLSRQEENKSDDAQNSPLNTQLAAEESLPPVFSSSENEGAFSEKIVKPFESLNGNVIYCRNDSMTDFDSDLSCDGLIDSNFEKNNLREPDKTFIKEVTEKEDVVIVCSKGVEEEPNKSKSSKKHKNSFEGSQNILKKKKRFPLLTATIEENNFRRSESPKSNKEVIVRKIWSRKKMTEDSTDNDEDSYISIDYNNTSVENVVEDESQTEIEKEIIVKKIWSRKKHELEDELTEKIEEKFDEIKINQTEISDEVVIKCGPKAKTSPKRRKNRSSTSETSKDTIMRKIWSGRCTFQTKAALKTYDSDVLPNCKENEISDTQSKSKRRKRPTSVSSMKRSRVGSEAGKDDDDDDDLDSLLEEIEREQLEKAIRSEFLQLRRSEKGHADIKEGTTPTVGLFTETTSNSRKEISEKKRKNIKKKLKHPKQSLLKRKKLIRKPFRRVLPSEVRNFSESTNRTNFERTNERSENSLDKNFEFGEETKTKNRKHKKHRHKHHHHKHKHKKSKHHKSAISKHKNKHEFVGKGEDTENADSFTILKKICQDIPNQIENESHLESRTTKRRLSSEICNVDSRVTDLFLFANETKQGSEVDFDSGLPGIKRYESMNIYEFVDDVPDFSVEGLRNIKK